MSIPTAKKNTTQPGAPDFNTLDEPIKDTIVRMMTRTLAQPLLIDNTPSFWQLRDIRAVGSKFYHVLYPKEKSSLLKECEFVKRPHSRFLSTFVVVSPFAGDLWGPLVLCTFMATFLQGQGATASRDYDGGPEFAEVFVIVWIGALVVTLNSKLLGGNM